MSVDAEKLAPKRKAKAKAKRPPSGNPVPDVPKPGPFEVRLVDEDREVYSLLMTGIRYYVDAVILADVWVEALRSHVVIWWPAERRMLYDSRPIAWRWPWWRGADE